MKKVTGIFSGLALTAVLALSVLGQTPEQKPMNDDNAQAKTTNTQSAKHKNKKAKKSQTNTSNSSASDKQSAKHKY